MIVCKYGFYVIFMLKLLFGINGFGMYCNMFLFNDEGNVFYDKDGELELSEIVYYFLGGLLKYVCVYIVVCNLIVNFYKCFVLGYEVFVYVVWSGCNCLLLVCVLEFCGLFICLELCLVDLFVNLYLVMVVLL